MIAFKNVKTISILICMFLLFLLLVTGDVRAERFFEKYNSWYTPIPSNPVLLDHSDDRVNDFRRTGINWSWAFNYGQSGWGHPIYQAAADTANVTVQPWNPNGTNGSNAIARGWNIIPIPVGAKSDGMTEWCAGSSNDGLSSNNNRDLVLSVLSYDGKWEWDLYKASKCSTTWRAQLIRKRARTIAAASEESYVWDGSGTGPIITQSGHLSQDDGLGLPASCTSSNLSGLITYNDYLSGSIEHALAYATDGVIDTAQWYPYPCMAYLNGYVDHTVRPYAGRYGDRIQLKPTVNCEQYGTGWNNFHRMVCRALKKYGAIFVESTGQSSEFYVESTYGKTNFWSGIIIGTFPISISSTDYQFVAPVCGDSRVCPNKPGGGDTGGGDTIPPAPPRVIEVK